jgi:myosin-5
VFIIQNLENGYHEVQEGKEPQSAPPAIKEYENGEAKSKKFLVERQLVGHQIIF